MANKSWKPSIIGFMCNWCSYAGADLAGTSRIQYSPEIRIIRVLCSGRVDPKWIIKAFLKGADGVIVLGCHFGDCHYITGNYQAEKKIKATQEILEMAGLEKERLYLDWVSAAEGMRFAKLIDQFTDKIRKLGPLKLDDEKRKKLAAALLTVSNDKVRWVVGREFSIIKDGNAFGEKLAPYEFHEQVKSIIKDNLKKSLIMAVLKSGPKTVREIASELREPESEILKQLVDLMRLDKVEMGEVKDRNPLFALKGE